MAFINGLQVAVRQLRGDGSGRAGPAQLHTADFGPLAYEVRFERREVTMLKVLKSEKEVVLTYLDEQLDSPTVSPDLKHALRQLRKQAASFDHRLCIFVRSLLTDTHAAAQAAVAQDAPEVAERAAACLARAAATGSSAARSAFGSSAQEPRSQMSLAEMLDSCTCLSAGALANLRQLARRSSQEVAMSQSWAEPLALTAIAFLSPIPGTLVARRSRRLDGALDALRTILAHCRVAGYSRASAKRAVVDVLSGDLAAFEFLIAYEPVYEDVLRSFLGLNRAGLLLGLASMDGPGASMASNCMKLLNLLAEDVQIMKPVIDQQDKKLWEGIVSCFLKPIAPVYVELHRLLWPLERCAAFERYLSDPDRERLGEARMAGVADNSYATRALASSTHARVQGLEAKLDALLTATKAEAKGGKEEAAPPTAGSTPVDRALKRLQLNGDENGAAAGGGFATPPQAIKQGGADPESGGAGSGGGFSFLR